MQIAIGLLDFKAKENNARKYISARYDPNV